jgi:hypothetical protein
MISHDSFFDFIVNAVDNPETPPPTMIVSLIPKELFSSSEGEEEDEDARTTKLLPLLPLLERAARTLRVLLVDDTFARLMLLFLVPIEDIPVVIVIVIINSFLYEYLRTASISLLREDDSVYQRSILGCRAKRRRVLKQRESERERERKNKCVKDMKT